MTFQNDDHKGYENHRSQLSKTLEEMFESQVTKRCFFQVKPVRSKKEAGQEMLEASGKFEYMSAGCCKNL